MKREHWSGRVGFVLAAAGSAIGLGNIWKFPFITGVNGGGAFVLIYLGCILLLGLPVMLCELAVGRRTGCDVYGAFQKLKNPDSKLAPALGWMLLGAAAALGVSGAWGYSVVAAAAGGLLLRFGFGAVGMVCVGAGLAILSYYAVVGGWALAYLWRGFAGALEYNSLDGAKAAFAVFIEQPGLMIGCQLGFMGLCAAVVWGGVRNGIERWSKILMPLLLVLLLAAIARGLTLPGAWKGVEFFLKPDFSKLNAGSILEALGHSFFTLSLGMGITITYGSYLKKNQSLAGASLWVIFLDTAAAILAGLAIFPAVFAMGFDPTSGPSLLFEVLPATFHRMPGGGGWFWSGLFFVMLSIAALTSGVSLFQIGVAVLEDHFKLSRHRAIVVVLAVVSPVGMLSAVSIANWNALEALQTLVKSAFHVQCAAGTNASSFFSMIDFVCSNWMLPLTGLLTAIFVGWEWGIRKFDRELLQGDTGWFRHRFGDWPGMFRTLNFLVRVVSPAVIVLVFLRTVGVL